MSEATGPFVGRQQELELLRSAALGDGPATVVVTGPLGIGKSRLIEELGASLRTSGRVLAVGRTWPGGGGPVLWPWFELLDAVGLSRQVLSGPAAARADRFARTMGALATLDPPPTLVIEDLHAADEETLQLARLVARAAGAWRGTLVGTRRPGSTGIGPTDALLDAIEGEARLVTLDGVGVEDVADLVRPSDPEVTDDLARLLHGLTGGNPLHLRTLTSGGPGPSGWQGGGLEERIVAEVERMPGRTRPLLDASAVIGGAAGEGELAAASATSPGAVADDVAPATAAGLVVRRAGDLALAHDAIRTVLLAALSPVARGEIHTRLARVLVAGDPDDRGRGARHALMAAELGVGDLDAAVGQARQVASELRRGTSLVAAAALLERAVEVTRSQGAHPSADLLADRAEATLACGRLLDARRQFDEAASTAERDGDVVGGARAALGLGGVWLGEHRDVASAARVVELRRAALDRLPAAESVLRARLALRISAERGYVRGEQGDVTARLAEVRATGDREALVEGLSAVHHASMHPGLERSRLALADEQLVVATAAGDELRVLVALVWRSVDLFLAGDPAAPRALQELTRRSEAVHCLAVVYVARVMEVMVLLRGGRLAEAERAAEACLELGTSVGDADAVGYYGVHLLAIRTWQGRELEILDVFEDLTRSPEHPSGDRSVRAACAVLAARAGQGERAASLLAECAADGLAAIPLSTTWLTCIVALAEAACAVGDEEVVAQAYELLLPHARLPVMPSFAIACFGSVGRTLGNAALALGATAEAVAHLRTAVEDCRRLGNEPARLQAQADLATALVAAGDVPGARQELGAAVRGARALGLDALATRWTASAPAAVWTPGVALTSMPGGGWEVSLGDVSVQLPDLVGCRYLAVLVGQPGREVPVLRLAMGVDGPGGRQELVDGRALDALQGRVEDLRGRIASAELHGESADSDRAELDAIARHLAVSLGLGGRVRSFDDLPERARTSVQKAVRRVIDRVEEEHPLLGGHLRQSTRTGSSCCYDPAPRATPVSRATVAS